MLTGLLAPGITVFLSFSQASSALLNEANFTKEEPVNAPFLRMSLTSKIFPYYSKNFQISSSFQSVGRLPTYTMISILLDIRSVLEATGDSDLFLLFSFGLSFFSSLRVSSFPFYSIIKKYKSKLF